MQGNKSLRKEIRFLKGIGEKKAQYFQRLGITTIEDLLHFYPRRYQDRSKITKIAEVKVGEVVTIKGRIIHTNLSRSRRGMPIYEAIVDDDSGVIIATWFNQPYLKDLITKDKVVLLYGRISFYRGLRITSPEYEILDREDEFSIHPILPVYSLSGNLTQNFIRKVIKNCLDNYAHHCPEILPYEIRRKLKLLNKVLSLRNIHFPQDWEHLIKARQRLAFEELFLLQLAIGIKRIQTRYLKKGIGHESREELKEKFFQFLPFQLTGDQLKVIKEIEKDMISPRPMRRLLQGEVGTGKTVIASFAALIASQGGYQTAIMVPTEILAQQQFLKIDSLLNKLGFRVEIIISEMDKKQKDEIKKQLREGEVDIVVGTHALLQEDIEFNNLGLVIIDEQHKFGVLQREILGLKGGNPDLLIMTATPIPRTLALTLFGDIDISTMKEFPWGEKRTITYWVSYRQRKQVYKFLEDMLKHGEQAFVVCPKIEKEKSDSLLSVEVVYDELKNKLGDKVALLHGKMRADIKEKVIAEFYRKKIKVLVSTIVVEVGIDIPDASIMIVEEAHRFGLSQLHQLRGRIGRAGQSSYFILIADPKTEVAQKRLEAISQIEDGFEIAEEDLNIRGPGELLGTKQHGFIDLKFKNMIKNINMLGVARKEAFDILKKDPFLQSHPNSKLKETIIKKFTFI